MEWILHISSSAADLIPLFLFILVETSFVFTYLPGCRSMLSEFT